MVRWTAASSTRGPGGDAASVMAARRMRVIAGCPRRRVMRETLTCSFFPLLLDGHFVMNIVRGDPFLARWWTAAEVGRVAGDLVAERLAGERVERQRHGNVGELRGQCAVVLGGVEAQGLDVSEQRD